ncbi:MAG: hypothetical protein ABI347_05430 [Nitrososphaera sp.]
MQRPAFAVILLLSAVLMMTTIGTSMPQASAAGAKTDFNGDGYADLVVGVPNEGINGKAEAGLVNVIYGSASGLSATFVPDQRFFQDYAAPSGPFPNIRDSSETGDRFGEAVAAGDFNKDGYTDLAVGVPGEDIGSIADAGAISVIYGSAAGLSATTAAPVADQLWTGSSPGISDDLPAACPVPISGIGNPGALASGDFNGDGYSDMAFGAATHFGGEGTTPVCGHSFYGSNGIAIVIYGSASGLAITSTRDDQVGREDSIADYAGTISAGDFNNDGRDDLVASFAVFGIVAPGDLTGGGLGTVKIYHGSAAGLPEGSDGLLQADQSWEQDSPSVEGDSETQDNFGAAVATGDFNNDGYADMAVGVPGEEAGVSGPGSVNNDDTGAVNVIYGSAAGLSATTTVADQLWTQDSANVEDASEIRDMFGTALG